MNPHENRCHLTCIAIFRSGFCVRVNHLLEPQRGQLSKHTFQLFQHAWPIKGQNMPHVAFPFLPTITTLPGFPLQTWPPYQEIKWLFCSAIPWSLIIWSKLCWLFVLENGLVIRKQHFPTSSQGPDPPSSDSFFWHPKDGRRDQGNWLLSISSKCDYTQGNSVKFLTWKLTPRNCTFLLGAWPIHAW